MLYSIAKKLLRPNGKFSFISTLPKKASILDVGCGNNSPYLTKLLRPDCNYTGVDILDYNQKKPIVADNYLLTSPEMFAKTISNFSNAFDAVISSHNLEHCEDRSATLEAMLGATKSCGKLFLSFPCEASTTFPSRKGTLNYFDDPTHRPPPPSFESIVGIIKRSGFRIEYTEERYQPSILWLVGALVEPLSRVTRKTMLGTWEFYGFESVIVATKLPKKL